MEILFSNIDPIGGYILIFLVLLFMFYLFFTND
jgi:hypothetical protein